MRFANWLDGVKKRLVAPVGRRVRSGRSRRDDFLRDGRAISSQIESLETRALLTVFFVSNTADSGAGSLRQAILDANSNSGADSILFSIPASGTQTITPLTALPALTDPGTTIDARTQNGYYLTNKPVVELNFSQLSVGTAGLYVAGDRVTIRGLAINRANGVGIWLAGSNSAITNNFIGTDASGTLDYGNLYQGIYVQSAANIISSNLISGNDANGIWIDSASADNNSVLSNYIGTTADGTSPLKNGINGVLSTGASGLTLNYNLIGANGNVGAWILGGSEHDIAVNFIGTNASGVTGLGNQSDGLRISDGATDSRVANNVVAGNKGYGVSTYSEATSQIGIWSNTIGLAPDGVTAMGNLSGGVYFGGSGNFLGDSTSARGNYISSNGGVGVWIAGTDQSVTGNYIGTDVSGTLDRGNATYGVGIATADNFVSGNLISGNNGAGVIVYQAEANRNVISGNKIGTNAAGTSSLGNSSWGVIVVNGSDNVIGSTGGGEAPSNLISGNFQGGVAIFGSSAARNVVAGNWIGTDSTGTLDVGNAYSGVYTGQGSGFSITNATGVAVDTEIKNNLISGNNNYGVWIAEASGTVVQGNSIGVGSDGQTPIGNSLDGMYVSGSNNTIGGTTSAERNVISANGRYGVWLAGNSNQLTGNYVGTSASGTIDRGNSRDGVLISSASNQVRGNVVSGNDARGVLILGEQADANVLTGNLIGLNATGTATIGNSDWGVLVGLGDNNQIGSPSSNTAVRNVISGNSQGGIAIVGASTDGNTVQNNLIGTTISGLSTAGNLMEGIYVGDGSLITTSQYGFFGVATNTLIGGSSSQSRNVVTSSVNRSGIRVTGNALAKVQGNYSGIGVDGQTVLGNRDYGVLVEGTNNIVGGDGDGTLDTEEGNLFSGNRVDGAMIAGNGNRLANNLIGTDATGMLLRENRYDGVEIRSANNVMAYNTVVAVGNVAVVAIIPDTSDNNQLFGNKIGTNVTGTATLGGASVGIAIVDGDNNDLGIASSLPSNKNVIGGNLVAGIIVGTGASETRIRNNAIGTDAGGTIPLPNQTGIWVGETTQFGFPGYPGPVTIGGTTSQERNTIAFNSGNGIEVRGTSTLQVNVGQNQFYSNGGIGIDLNGDGLTPNDPLDSDAGPNTLQNSPTLLHVIPGSQTWVQGHLLGAPNSSFTLSFYLSDPSSIGNPQGLGWLHSVTVTTDQYGMAPFDVLIDHVFAVGDAMTATATDSQGNTSEFSASTLAETPAPLSGSLEVPNPSQRTSPVTSIDITFSEEIDLDSFSIDDFSLRRDGGDNLLTGSQTLTWIEGTTYRLGNLTGLTSAEGAYELSLDLTRVQGLRHNAGTEQLESNWLLDATGPGIVEWGAGLPPFRNNPLNTIEITFTEAIDAATLTSADLILKRGSSNIPLGGQISIAHLSGATYKITGLAALTGINGAYSLTANAATVTDLLGNAGFGSRSFSWTMDTSAPRIVTLSAVTSPSGKPVNSLTVTFSEAIEPASLTIANFMLSLEGGANLLSGQETITGSGKSWTINGLAPLTTGDGLYQLSVNATGVTDLAGNPASGSLSRSWVMSNPPTIVSLSSPGIIRSTPVDSIDVTFSKEIDLSTLSAADFRLFFNGANILTGAETISQVGTSVYRLSGLASATAAAGSYRLVASAVAVKDLNGVSGKGSASQSWQIDLAAPSITGIWNINPSTRRTPVGSATVTLSEQIDLATLSAADFTLTRNGGANLLTGLEPVIWLSDRNYQISGLDSLTGEDGNYVLTLHAGGFSDPAGNLSTGTKSVTWTVDTLAPVSSIQALPATANKLSIPLSISGADANAGNGSTPSGIRSYDIYVSVDGQPFSFWKSITASTTSSLTTATFLAQSDHTYTFHSIAYDRAGNIETKPANTVEATILVPDLSPPQTQVSSVDSTSSTLIVSILGKDQGSNGIISTFDLYVSINGATATRVASIPADLPDASGTYSAVYQYRAISDGTSRSYRFYSIARDGVGNVEAAPATPGDVTIATAFTPKTLQSVDIQHGQTQRSLVQTIDLTLSSPDDVAVIVAGLNNSKVPAKAVTLTRYSLSGTSPVVVKLLGKATLEGEMIRLNFGSAGLPDGYYELGIDLDGNGVVETIRHFARLQGDLNGDLVVDNADLAMLVSNFGQTGPGNPSDLNFDGVVDSRDQVRFTPLIGQQLDPSLPIDA